MNTNPKKERMIRAGITCKLKRPYLLVVKFIFKLQYLICILWKITIDFGEGKNCIGNELYVLIISVPSVNRYYKMVFFKILLLFLIVIKVLSTVPS